VTEQRLVALVVEDDPEHLKGIRARLEDRNVDAISVGSLAEAMEAMDDGGFDFVILDLGLPRRLGDDPEADVGYEVLEALRLRWSREDLFVLVLTAAPDKFKVVTSVLHMKGNAYAPRFDVRELQVRLAEAIVAATQWRTRRGDLRLVIATWNDGKVLIGNHRDRMYAVVDGKRRLIGPPSEALHETLARLVYADRVEGLDLGTSSRAKSQASRLSDWADQAFRCEAGGQAFVSRSTSVVAKIKVALAKDPAERSDYTDRRRHSG